MYLENNVLFFQVNEKAYELRNKLNGEAYIFQELFALSFLDPEMTLNSSDFLLENIEEKENELIFNYQPYKTNFFTLIITCTLNLKENLLGKIKIQTKDSQKKTRLDVVTFFPIKTKKEKLVFTYPTDIKIEDTPYSFLETELFLGQPVYLKGFYFGSLFPGNDNQGLTTEEEAIVSLKYYSGHFLQEFEQTPFISWNFVVGAVKGTSYEEMKAEFLADIEKIAQPTKLRIQYNSWYDAFMAVTEEQFLTLAEEMNDFVVNHDLPQFDAYVLDDGWNNYNDPIYTGIDERRSGTEYNTSGFWEFNNKFPQEGYKIKNYLEKIGSTFGMWLGPQGGYELQDMFAQYLESVDTSLVNNQAALGKAIDVNDSRYLEKLEQLFLSYQEKFSLSYWKLDGFASRPSLKEGYHLTGGYKNRFYTTQLWERWIKIFEKMREVTPDIFLNLTCYVPVSPWFLQWANTIWLQNSGDLEIAEKAFGSIADQMITGRDEIYLKKVFQEKLQFPLSHFYNHEPIYGNAVKTTMSDLEFEKYLIGNVFRGSLLWDMHLSPNLLNQEKGEILRKILIYLRQNETTLATATMLSYEGFYGYYGKNKNHGFLYLRNPSAVKKVVNLKELPLEFQKAYEKKAISLYYGKEKALSLQPLEIRVYEF